jgi:hypothetical protein
MTKAEEIALAEDLAAVLARNRIPANELGGVTRLLERGRSVGEVKADLVAVAQDPDHFSRTGQTKRYAGDLARLVVGVLASKSVTGDSALRVLGWARRLAAYNTVTGRVPVDRGGGGGLQSRDPKGGTRRTPAPRSPYEPSTPRGQKRR